MAARIFGSGIKRREDPRLITGQAKYTDDFVLPGMAHLAVVRSPYAHAKIKAIRTKKAAAMEGVLGVFTGKDMKDAGFGGIPCAWVVPGSEAKTPPYLPIAIDIGALRRQRGGDRRRRGPLPRARRGRRGRGRLRAAAGAPSTPRRPREKGEPQLHAEVPNNVAFHWKVSGGDVDAAFKAADVVVKERIINQRLIPNAMEPRAALAQYLSASDEFTLWVTSQNPAHRAVPAVPRHRDAGAQDPRHRAGGRRRLRQQDPPLPRRLDGRLRLEDAGRAREVDRDAERELPLHDPRPRPHPGRRDGGEEGRHDPRPAGEGVGQPGRLPLDGLDRDPDHPPRAHALGRVRHQEHPRGRLRRLHEHDADRRLPRRRAAPRRPSWSSVSSTSSPGS